MIQFMTHPTVVAVRQQLRVHITSSSIQNINIAGYQFDGWCEECQTIKLHSPSIFLAIECLQRWLVKDFSPKL